MKFQWNVADLNLFNESRNILYQNLKSKYVFACEDLYQNLKSKYVFACEDKYTKEEKIEAVNWYIDTYLTNYDYNLSDVLAVMEEMLRSGTEIKTCDYGYFNKNSFKAWANRHNFGKVFRTDNSFWFDTKLSLLGINISFFKLNCTSMEEYLNDRRWHTYSSNVHNNLIDELFHAVILQLLDKETTYFYEHDEYTLLSKEAMDGLMNTYSNLGLHICYGSEGSKLTDGTDDWYKNGHSRNFTTEELKTIIEYKKKVDDFMEGIMAEVNEKIKF